MVIAKAVMFIPGMTICDTDGHSATAKVLHQRRRRTWLLLHITPQSADCRLSALRHKRYCRLVQWKGFMQCLQMSKVMTWHAGPPQSALAPEAAESGEAEDTVYSFWHGLQGRCKLR